jgi:hypothetical protein
MKATLQFMDAYGKYVHMVKQFSDEKHLNNFIAYVKNKYKYTLDEVWY